MLHFVAQTNSKFYFSLDIVGKKTHTNWHSSVIDDSVVLKTCLVSGSTFVTGRWELSCSNVCRLCRSWVTVSLNEWPEAPNIPWQGFSDQQPVTAGREAFTERKMHINLYLFNCNLFQYKILRLARICTFVCSELCLEAYSKLNACVVNRHLPVYSARYPLWSNLI